MGFYRLINETAFIIRTLTKKARKITAAQYKAKRILSIYVELGGLCAMTSIQGTSDHHNAVMLIGNLRARTHKSVY